MAPVPNSYTPTAATEPRAGGTSVLLPVVPVYQPPKTSLCWAAVAVMTRHFYQPASQLRMCDLATWAWAQRRSAQSGHAVAVERAAIGSACCSGSVPKDCTEEYYLGLALDHLHHLVRPITNVLSDVDAVTLIAFHRRLFGMRLDPGSGGHVVLVVGYSRQLSPLDLVVIDPAWGQYAIPFATAKNSWTHLYRTTK